MVHTKSRRPADKHATKPPRPSILAGMGRLISWHRRKLAAVCAMGAVTAGIVAVSPPDPPSTPTVVAAHQLDGGARVTAHDVTRRPVPEDTVPEDAVPHAKDVVGRTLVSPVAKGSMLTKLDVLGTSTVAHAGNVIAPVRIADSSVIKLLRVGDHVDVVASDPESHKGGATVLAKGARVVTIPSADEKSSGLGAAAGGSGKSATLLLVEVSSAEATKLANAASGSQLSVLLG